MNDKLSQAVKLYDQILTQQVAQPRWRTAATSSTPYQQQSFDTGYSQWPHQVQVNPTSYHAPAETPSSPSYASPLPTQAQLPQWNQPQQSQYSSQMHRTSSPEMVASQTSAPLSQYAQPLQYQSNQVASVQSTSSFTPVSLVQSPVPIQYQPPTPAQYQPLTPKASIPQAPVAPSLGRANSATYTSATPVPYLARNATVASHASTQQYQQQQQYQAPPQQQRQHQYQQQQHQPYQIASPPPAPPSLPQFPVVPTAAPQPTFPQFPVVPTAAPQPTFPMYGSTISSGFEERKEALLIDL